MTTINDLAVANSFSPDDKLPMWSNANGVTRGLPISVLTANFLTQDDINQIAASSSVETFISDLLPNPDNLPTFTAGTTLALTLAKNYVSKDNINVHFDASFQGPDQFSLVSTTLTFTSPIPAGVSNIYVSGGAVREIGAPSDGTVTTSTLVDDAVTAAKLAPNAVVDSSVAAGTKLSNRINNIVDVVDIGADPTGVQDSTTAFQNAVNTGRKVIIPAGTFLIRPVTVPSNTVIVGQGYATLIKAKAGATGSGLFQTANGAQFVSIGAMRIDITPGDSPTPMGVYLNASVGAIVHDIVMSNAGNHGVGSDGDIDTVIERLTLSNSFGGAIYLNTSTRPRIRGCKVDDSNGLNSGITVSIGSDVTVEDNYVASMPAGFGIHLARVSRGKILHNTTFNTKIEGINAEGCTDIDIFDNICTWSGSTSNDFGISVFGSTAQGDCVYIKVRGNKVYNCASSGIALAAQGNTQFCDVSDNTIVNCNAQNLGIPAGGGAGVMLYGTGCQQNTVQNNKIIDTGVAHLLNGIQEVDSQGYGQASMNRFMNNHVYNAASATVFKQASSVEALSRDNGAPLLSWTPTIASTTGALGTVSLAAAEYYETEKRIDYYVRFTIVNNGTGAGTLTFTLPYAVNFVTGHGRENAVSGKALTVTGAAGNKGEVRNYDNSYPGSAGAIIEVAGTFFRQ